MSHPGSRTITAGPPTKRRRLLAALSAMTVAPAVAASDRARDWPARPVTLIVPGPAGGTPDLTARRIGKALEARIGQPVVVDNRAGASGAIGVSAVARATPDGHTLLMGFAQTMAINPAISRRLTYDPVRDFAPVARLVTFELALVVPASEPATRLPEFVARLRRQTAPTAYGSFGAGTPSQFAGDMFRRQADFQGTHVAYKGSAPLINDLLGGHVRLGFVVPQIAVPHVRAGRLRMLAITGTVRSRELPEVPTMTEMGYDEVQAGGWYGLYAPAGTADPIVARLSREIAAVLSEAATAEELRRQDLAAAWLGPRDFARFQDAEIARWRAVAARTGFRIED